MKQRTLLFILLLLSTLTASAYDAEIDSIFYNLNASTMEATVTFGNTKYTGSVTIPETVSYNNLTYSVTSIEKEAFLNCASLTSITIPNSVISIGDHAFTYCSGLTSVTIPNGVTSIGSSAFSGCSSLTSVTIGNSVTSIGDYAFGDCSQLASVTIGNSVTSIGGSVFFGCSNLTSISVENGNTVYDSRDNCNAIIETATNTLIAGCKNTIIPNTVTSIGYYAFGYCSGLTSVTIPNSVTSIGGGAFYDCSGLTSVTIPNSVTSIGNSAFSGCSSLTSITIPNSVSSIGDYAFSGCSQLASVTIGNSVTSIGGSVFFGCSNLTSISVENGNTVYDSRDNCNAIIETATNTLIAGCKNTIIPNSVTSIGYQAFRGCSGLTSVTIPNSVTSIGGGAFYDCSGLTSVTIPNSVTSIGNSAFSGCSSLTSITIPNSVSSIGDYAFSGCSQLASVTIGNSVTSIGGSVFSGCSSLTSISVEDGNTVYDSRDNCNAIIETATNTLIAGCKNTIIPNSVTSIGYQAFHDCSSLTSITFPNSVTSIGDYAFWDCSQLASVTIGNSVTTIGNMAFSGCRNLVSLTIPNSVTTIGDWGFRGCRSLVSVTIPNSVTTIGTGAFYNCTGLTDVYCYAERVPTTGQDVFGQDGYYDDSPTYYATLHVPAVSIEAYMETSPWNEFGEIVKSDYLDVADLNIKAGESNTQEISLNNCLTDLVGFQMDLTLPEGIGIDKTGCTLSSRITDNKQELTIGKLESGAYRITSTSLSLTPISGYDGTLLTLKLTAGNDCIGGQATISNIIFSTAESKKAVMSDKTFDITILKKYNLRYTVDGEEYSTEEVVETTPLTLADEPTKDGYTFSGWSELPETMPNHDVEITGRFYLYGDVNTDEAVNVVDVVDIARFVVATPSVKFLEKLADLNKDNTVNIADAVTLVNHIAGDQNFARATASSEPFNYDQCQLQLLSTQENALSLCLDGDADFTAFQFDAELPQGIDVSVMRINGQRKDGHQLLYNKVADNHYRVAVLSLSNAVFKSNEGELLNISIDGQPTDEISVDNILFVTKNGTSITFNGISLSGTVTGIADVHVNEGNNVIYDLQGRKLSKLQHGVNIVNGKKIVVK